MIGKDIKVLFVGQRQWVEKERFDALEKAANEVLRTYMPQFNDSRTVDDCLVGLAAAVAAVAAVSPQSDAGVANEGK